jgi:hypothetical protein
LTTIQVKMMSRNRAMKAKILNSFLFCILVECYVPVRNRS